MRFAKPIIGVMLILAAAGGLIFWEMQGRQMVMQERVLIAARTINQGELITKTMFSVMGIDNNNIIEGALDERSLMNLEGQFAKQHIPRNSQISTEYFTSENYELEKGSSVFALKPSWIDGRSSSVRKGDVIEIYDDRGDILLGIFKVAFVKDTADKEVTSVEEIKESGSILQRTNATGFISNIEIVTTVGKYSELVKFIEDTGQGLLIVQIGEHP